MEEALTTEWRSPRERVSESNTFLRKKRERREKKIKGRLEAVHRGLGPNGVDRNPKEWRHTTANIRGHHPEFCGGLNL